MPARLGGRQMETQVAYPLVPRILTANQVPAQLAPVVSLPTPNLKHLYSSNP